MSTGLNIIKGRIIERSNAVLTCRIIHAVDDAVLLAGDVSGCHLKVYDLASQTPSTDIFVGADPGAAVITGITDDAAWTVDSTGRNFLYTLNNSEITGGYEGGHTYRAQFYIDKCILLTDTHVPGAFTIGETITGGTSGSTAVLISAVINTSLTCMPTAAAASVSTVFTAGETVTGSLSTSTALVDTITYDPVYAVFELGCDGILT